jgi:GxxExxY protein
MKHEELTRDIIGAAMQVLNTLSPGLDEKLYERALILELKKRGHTCDQQKVFRVSYDGQDIGKLIPDLIVDGLVIADPQGHQRLQRDSYRANARLSEYHWHGDCSPA